MRGAKRNRFDPHWGVIEHANSGRVQHGGLRARQEVSAQSRPSHYVVWVAVTSIVFVCVAARTEAEGPR